MGWETFSEEEAQRGKPFGKFATIVSEENLMFSKERRRNARAVINGTATLEQEQKHLKAEEDIKGALAAAGQVGYSNPNPRS